MHIPDGFLSPITWIPAGAVAAGTVALATRKVRRDFQDRMVPKLAVTTALAFVLGSVAIPIPGGTSVHATGVALLALQFGVAPAYLALTGVLVLQALGFGIGGVTSLPVNALCLGLAGAASAAGAARLLRFARPAVARFVAGWASVAVPAALLALILGLQPRIAHTAEGAPLFFPFGWKVTLGAVLLPGLAVGIGEGALTVAVMRILHRSAPAPEPKDTP